MDRKDFIKTVALPAWEALALAAMLQSCSSHKITEW